jgi:glycosyltransferase involved in cell wall biosynthesis
VGYTFFEDSILRQEWIDNAKGCFDTVVTGSTWCERILQSYGLDNVTTIIQGIDPTIFNMTHREKEYLRESFVLFSGGKFELRKGQDLVLRAFRTLQDRYRDVMLVTSWYNHWPASMRTMTLSPHIRFSAVSGEYLSLMQRTLVENGINPDRVITLPPYPNIMMTRFYRNSDVGVFPNRCEGGTNLVMMEYMACGKPVIAANTSGHRDVLTTHNSLRLQSLTPLTISDERGPVAVWDEPSLDELVAHLEWAYHHREDLKRIGEQAGMDLCTMTWEATGKTFYALLAHQPVGVEQWT